jgi:hypothetical protein
MLFVVKRGAIPWLAMVTTIAIAGAVLGSHWKLEPLAVICASVAVIAVPFLVTTALATERGGRLLDAMANGAVVASVGIERAVRIAQGVLMIGGSAVGTFVLGIIGLVVALFVVLGVIGLLLIGIRALTG